MHARATITDVAAEAGVSISTVSLVMNGKGAVADAMWAKRLGYRMKSLVDPAHAKAINAVFTPSNAEILKARKIVAAFEKARKAGKDRAKVDGALIEVPNYAAAKRLLESAANNRPPRRKKRR